MQPYKYILLFSLGLMFYKPLQSQNPGVWLMNSGNTNLGAGVSFFTDIQFRKGHIVNNLEQTLLYGGLTFRAKDLLFTLGGARVANYIKVWDVIDPKSLYENQAWEQLAYEFIIKPFYLENRTRVEERFFSDKTYATRFRYLVRLTLPLNHRKMITGTYFVTCYDELFLNFKNKLFDENRFYVAGGYKFNPRLSVQSGYLFQTRSDGTFGFFQLLLAFNVNIKRHYSSFSSEQ